jgi:hypothetical protein
MCFQSTILVCEMYKLWMNEFRMISIIKLWDAKFVIMYFIVIQFFLLLTMNYDNLKWGPNLHSLVCLFVFMVHYGPHKTTYVNDLLAF